MLDLKALRTLAVNFAMTVITFLLTRSIGQAENGLSQICMLASTLSSEVVFIIVFFAAFPLILETEISSLHKQMKIDTFIFNTITCNKQCIQRLAPEAL
jgi:hypothetical protein